MMAVIGIPGANHWYCYFAFDIDKNRPAIVWEIPHFGLFPAFSPERPAFLALF